MENQVNAKIDYYHNLPTLPQVLIKLIDACNNDRSTSRQLSDIVTMDPAISARIMRLVNSAYFGLPRKITTIENAVIFLGMEGVRNIAITASVIETFSQIKGSHLFNLSRFWWHSFLTGCIARRMAEAVKYPNHSEVFLAGLLHDIGRLLLWSNFNTEYSQLLHRNRGETELHLAEKAEFGVSHAEIGAWMMRKWETKSFAADAILYHHDPLDRILDSLPLLRLIYLANIMAVDLEEGELSRGAENTAKSLFGLSEMRLAEICALAVSETTETAQAFGISVDIPIMSKVGEPAVTDDRRKDLIFSVKTNALLHGTLQNLLSADSLESILKVASSGANILFDITSLFYFLHDFDQELLVGYSLNLEQDTHFINEMALPLYNDRNLISRSLDRNMPLDSFSLAAGEELSIIDEQMINLLHMSGMMCVPMMVRNEKMGVLVIGLNEPQAKRLGGKKKFIELFANYLGMSLYLENMRRTHAKRIENERREASTLIARKVTHEVNNPLGIIKNYLKILEQKLPDSVPAREELKIISEEIDRVSHILKQLTAFSGPKLGLKESVDINELLERLMQLIDKSILQPAKVRPHFSLDPNLPLVQTDKNTLVQILINLIKNAAEAMTEGGNIYIETRFAELYSKKIIGIEGDVPAGAEIVIRDDGPGIPEQIQSRIFEPSHSTKGENHYGLGLSIVHSLVKELKGTISWSSTLGAGTQFKILLPIDHS